MGAPRLLVIGCGKRPYDTNAEWTRDNIVNLDMVDLPGVDVVHDLDVHPWPFESESFDSIVADSVLEHVSDFIGAMQEAHRVLKLRRENGDPGLLIAQVPLAGSFNHFTDPTHKRGFTGNSFDFFDPETGFGAINDYYSWARFRVWKKTVCADIAGCPPELEYGGEFPRILGAAAAWCSPGVDLRFYLTKLPKDLAVEELHRRSMPARRVHPIGMPIYQPKDG